MGLARAGRPRTGPVPPLTPDREALIVSNQGLVWLCAYRHARRTGLDAEELAAEGQVGLLKAAQTFDPDRGVRFSTYAARCIENEIRMYLRAHRRVRRHELSLDDACTVSEDGDPLARADLVAAGDDPGELTVERAAAGEAARRLRRLIRRLPRRQRQVVRLRYLGPEPMSYERIATRLGLSPTHVLRLDRAARARLRALLEAEAGPAD